MRRPPPRSPWKPYLERVWRGFSDFGGWAEIAYLALLGWLLMAFAWARTLRIALNAPVDDPFYAEKRITAHYFLAYPLAAFDHRLKLIEAGCRAPLPYAGQAFVD